jgi:hypothetical protein
MAFEINGGVPFARRVTLVGAAASTFVSFGGESTKFLAKHLRVRAVGGDVRLYFDPIEQAGTPPGANYVSLATGEIYSEMYDGFGVWLYSAAGATAEVVAYQRKG